VTVGPGTSTVIVSVTVGPGTGTLIVRIFVTVGAGFGVMVFVTVEAGGVTTTVGPGTRTGILTVGPGTVLEYPCRVTVGAGTGALLLRGFGAVGGGSWRLPGSASIPWSALATGAPDDVLKACMATYIRSATSAKIPTQSHHTDLSRFGIS
jgi:hypothetical protein